VGRRAEAKSRCPRRKASLTAFLDTNVVVRHLTGDPPELAARAAAAFEAETELLLVDLVVAECAYVLESFYEVPRVRGVELMRAGIAFPSIRAGRPSVAASRTRDLRAGSA